MWPSLDVMGNVGMEVIEDHDLDDCLGDASHRRRCHSFAPPSPLPGAFVRSIGKVVRIGLDLRGSCDDGCEGVMHFGCACSGSEIWREWVGSEGGVLGVGRDRGEGQELEGSRRREAEG